MKKIYGLAALCAAMTLASCSNNDEPNVTPTGETTTGYIAVNIVTATDTRATYEIGDSNAGESDVTNGKLYVFSNDATPYLMSVAEIFPTGWSTPSNTGEVETTSSKLQMVKIAIDEGKEVGNVICVLNPGDLAIATGTASTFDVVRKKIIDYTTPTAGSFMMTSSAYRGGTTGAYTSVYATNFNGHVYNDATEAGKHAQNIYVERNVARIDAKFASADATDGSFPQATDAQGSNGANIEIDGNQTQLKVVVTGVEVANMPETSYLVKDIKLTGWPEFTADNADDVWGTYRCHWANYINKADLTFSNKKYTDIIKNFSASTDYAKIDYVFENTNQDNDAAKTSILITAELKKDNNGTLENVDLYRLVQNGKYYEGETNIKAAIALLLQEDGYEKKVSYDDNGETKYKWVSIMPEDFEIKTQRTAAGKYGYSGLVQLKTKDSSGADLNLVLRDDTGEIEGDNDIATVNNTLATVTNNKGGLRYRVYHWDGGKTYYYKAIQASEVGLIGVVRNHIYKLSLNSVYGLGTPVFDPNEKLVPEDPDPVTPGTPDKSYIDAFINILNWAVYTQNVNFGQ